MRTACRCPSHVRACVSLCVILSARDQRVSSVCSSLHSPVTRDCCGGPGARRSAAAGAEGGAGGAAEHHPPAVGRAVAGAHGQPDRFPEAPAAAAGAPACSAPRAPPAVSAVEHRPACTSQGRSPSPACGRRGNDASGWSPHGVAGVMGMRAREQSAALQFDRTSRPGGRRAPLRGPPS